MDAISKSELQQLLSDEGGAHVSIYMPSVVAGPQTEQNPIRFKNLVRAASNELAQGGYDKREIDQLLGPAQQLIGDHAFWQHQDDGLALFINAQASWHYRLPLTFDEVASTGERFYLKPMLSLFSGDGRFYILTLSQQRVRLLAASRHAVRELALGEEVPVSVSDALGHELSGQSLQTHGGAGSRAAGGGGPIQHAQGAGDDDTKLDLRKFFNVLDRALRPYLRVPHAPLVLAGVDYLLPLYRQETHYHPVLDEGLTGNRDDAAAETLLHDTWPLVEAYFSQGRREAEERYFELSDTGRAANELETVVLGAVEGRVASLFVARGVSVWGTVHAEQRRVERHAERVAQSEELLDLAAVQTYAMGGEVYVVDPEAVPEGREVAAILRY